MTNTSVFRGGIQRELFTPPPKKRRKKRTTWESDEQAALFQWAAIQANKIRELHLLFTIPNGGWRYKATAARLKREGVKRGVPDMCLPVARSGYHGLYIELKVGRGVVSEHQHKWQHALRRQGYMAAVCYGWQSAADLLLAYLDGNVTSLDPVE